MPRHNRAAWQLVLTTYRCHECGARVGHGCRTGAGRPTEPHADRARQAAARGWAAADCPPRCYRCLRPLPGPSPAPGRCARCVRREDGPPPTHATKDHPGPDGSYDVPIWEDP
jgi:hypothetical protein